VWLAQRFQLFEQYFSAVVQKHRKTVNSLYGGRKLKNQGDELLFEGRPMRPSALNALTMN
jgi:hypothetical protein